MNGSTIGNNAYVGPNTTIEKALLENNCFVGMGSVVRNGSVIKGVVAAGSLVRENTIISEGEVKN